MGYYTTYTLEVFEKTSDGYVQIPSTQYEEEIDECLFNNETKWYDHERDMERFSLRHPQLVFVLEGVGEEFPDMWRKYFKNGKCIGSVRPEIVWPKAPMF